MRRRTCGISPGRIVRRTRTETATVTATVTASGIRRRRATDTAIRKGQWPLCTGSCANECLVLCKSVATTVLLRQAARTSTPRGGMVRGDVWGDVSMHMAALDCCPSDCKQGKHEQRLLIQQLQDVRCSWAASSGSGWAFACFENMHRPHARCCQLFAAVPCSCKTGRLGA